MLNNFIFTARGQESAPLLRGIIGVAVIIVFAAAIAVVDTTAHGQVSEPVPSAGCAEPARPVGNSTLSFAADGAAGSYIQDVPPGADHPLPLVLDLHGYLEPALVAHYGTALAPYGYLEGYVTITPEIEELALPQWDFAEGSRDTRFLSDLLTHVESTLCVDRLRIYVTGLSMGAFTSSSLACQLSDRIAAIAAVAGLQDFAWCHTTRPVPVLAFHGTADPIVAYTGGAGPLVKWLPTDNGSSSSPDATTRNGPGPQSIPDDAAAWARRNGCETEATERRIAPDVVLREYPCPADATVQLYTIIGGGHIWPGSTSLLYPPLVVGNNTTSINANDVIWDFFQNHPLPG